MTLQIIKNTTLNTTARLWQAQMISKSSQSFGKTIAINYSVLCPKIEQMTSIQKSTHKTLARSQTQPSLMANSTPICPAWFLCATEVTSQPNYLGTKTRRSVHSHRRARVSVQTSVNLKDMGSGACWAGFKLLYFGLMSKSPECLVPHFESGTSIVLNNHRNAAFVCITAMIRCGIMKFVIIITQRIHIQNTGSMAVPTDRNRNSRTEQQPLPLMVGVLSLTWLSYNLQTR